MTPPLVSVVIPVHRGHPLLLETLRSLRDQTWSRWEAVLVDDGSPDPQEPLVRAAVDDPRLRFIRTENLGPGRARLRGLAEARGELLQLLDQDDLLSPEKLELQVERLAARPEAHLTYTDVEWFHDEGARRVRRRRRPFYAPPPAGDVLARLLRHNFLSNEAVLFRRSLLEGLTLEDLPGNRFTNDWHFWLQALLPGRVVDYAPRGLASKRVHPGCTSADWQGAVEWRCRVFAWLDARLEAAPAPGVTCADVAAMQLEWAKDEALLGRGAEARRLLGRAAARDPAALARHPQRTALALLLQAGPLRRALLGLRARRDPYQSVLGP